MFPLQTYKNNDRVIRVSVVFSNSFHHRHAGCGTSVDLRRCSTCAKKGDERVRRMESRLYGLTQVEGIKDHLLLIKPVLPGRVGGRRYILFVRFWVRVPVQVVPTVAGVVLYRTVLYCTVPFCTVTVWIYRYRSGTVPYWYRYWYWYLVPVLYPVVYLLYVPVRYCTVLCFDQYGTVPTVPVPIN